jgi:hypothetical protein
MDEKTAETLAIAAGLEKAWTNHRADVLDALATLAAHKNNLPRASNPAVEPVPAYRLERRVRDTA